MINNKINTVKLVKTRIEGNQLLPEISVKEIYESLMSGDIIVLKNDFP
jgi:hypothetical protein